MQKLMRRRNIAIVVTALVFCAAAARPVPASPAMALPNCLGVPQVRPASVMFACGDGNFSASKLQWTGWGEPFAAATGVGEMNDCTPNCAAGKLHSYRIVVIASGHQTCPDGRPAYQTITYAWIGKVPIPGDPDPTFRYPCKPRV